MDLIKIGKQPFYILLHEVYDTVRLCKLKISHSLAAERGKRKRKVYGLTKLFIGSKVFLWSEIQRLLIEMSTLPAKIQIFFLPSHSQGMGYFELA